MNRINSFERFVDSNVSVTFVIRIYLLRILYKEIERQKKGKNRNFSFLWLKGNVPKVSNAIGKWRRGERLKCGKMESKGDLSFACRPLLRFSFLVSFVIFISYLLLFTHIFDNCLRIRNFPSEIRLFYSFILSFHSMFGSFVYLFSFILLLCVCKYFVVIVANQKA